jgi:ferrous iron transport protein B
MTAPTGDPTTSDVSTPSPSTDSGNRSAPLGVAGTRELTVALAGNPNVGKTTLFNALTGLKQKVANYPGVTVEKKVGRCTLPEEGPGPKSCEIIDLPGTYSLASRSPDEHVARQVVLGQIQGTPRPDAIVVVADASNLERNLYLVTQVLELGRPVVVALSMVDVAQGQGKTVDTAKLSEHLGAPVVVVQAHKGVGIDTLKAEIAQALVHAATERTMKALELPLPELLETHIERLKKILAEEGLSAPDQAYFDAHLMLSGDDDDGEVGAGAADMPDLRRNHPKVRAELNAAMEACANADIDPINAEVETHYNFISTVVADVVHEDAAAQAKKISRTDRIDRIVTHKIWGMAIFIGLMGLMFWTIFSWAGPIMNFLSDTVVNGWIGNTVGNHMAEGPLKSLITDGIIAGVGNVVVFLPQIALLFLFLAILEDSGYMSRAAFLMDRVMSKVGLHGKSFIPLLSGYACAIPAMLGTRVIENRRDRLATILVLPLMSCSARLPVYTLIIGTFFAGYAAITRAGILLSMYALGTLTAFGLAFLFKRTLLKGPTPAFILEMPPYRLPHWKVVITTVGQRCWAFLKRAGTVIFAMSVIMWAATHYPKPAKYSKDYVSEISKLDEEIAPIKEKAEAYGKSAAASGVLGDNKPAVPEYVTQYETLSARLDDLKNAEAQEVLNNSAAGRVGRFIAPVFKPLGYDWKLSIGVTGAFFAREVVVSTLGVVYSVGEADETSEALKESIRADYTPLVGISLMVFVVFCMQCLPTLAVVKRETGHIGWPVFMFVYMTGLAWVAAFIVYQGGRMMGW